MMSVIALIGVLPNPLDSGGPRDLSAFDQDQRVATVAYRIESHGIGRCHQLGSGFGLSFRQLSQFRLTDRGRAAARYGLDRGAIVIAVAGGSPAEDAHVQRGDIVSRINGRALPMDPMSGRDFDQLNARRLADRLDDLLEGGGPRQSAILTLLRDGRELSVAVTPRPVCQSRAYLARSSQRNAFADGTHVFLTTGLLRLARNDDELAFIIAHEIAHNILGHWRIVRAKQQGLPHGPPADREHSDTRTLERQADLMASDLMLDAGYDPLSGSRVIDSVSRETLGIGLFSSHGSGRGRRAAVRAHVAERRQANSGSIPEPVRP